MQSAVHARTSGLSGLRLLALACSLLASFCCLSPAWALYKVVGPDGKITYTDRPPSDQPAQALKTNGAKSSTDNLPFELQRVAVKYPVTLYTSPNCGACDTGRQFLKTRGVPFQEKTIVSGEDIRAFTKLEGTDQLPVVRIGQKQIIGFSQTEWASYVDAAGYPAKSLLPLNYKWPAASPMAPQEAKIPAPDGGFARPAPRREDNAPSPGSEGSPPGFRF